MHISRKAAIVFALLALLLGVGVVLAAPAFTGTYQTDTTSGAITFTSTRCIQAGWCNGTYRIDGVKRPGYFYVLRDGSNRTTFNWFYDAKFNKPAGNMLLVYDVSAMRYDGPITFYARNGTMTSSGTATVYLK